MTANDFKTLFLPCHRRLFRMAYRLSGNQQDAEDLVQETFLKLWNRRHELTDIENPEAFSVITIKNIWLDNIRRKRLDWADSPPDDYLIVDNADIEKQIETNDTSENILKLINNLPEQQRIVMMMRDVSDLSFEEIVDATGLSQGNIRTLLSRARKRIRDQYNRLLNYERH